MAKLTAVRESNELGKMGVPILPPSRELINAAQRFLAADAEHRNAEAAFRAVLDAIQQEGGAVRRIEQHRDEVRSLRAANLQEVGELEQRLIDVNAKLVTARAKLPDAQQKERDTRGFADRAGESFSAELNESSVPIHQMLKDELEETIARVRLAAARLRCFEGAVGMPRNPYDRLTLETFTAPVPGVRREFEQPGWSAITSAVTALVRRT
jgi:hypothetical protein